MYYKCKYNIINVNIATNSELVKSSHEDLEPRSKGSAIRTQKQFFFYTSNKISL